MVKKNKQISVPDEADEPEAEQPTHRFGFQLPEGWLGIFLLLIVAAVSGGLIANFWPAVLGGGDIGSTQDRVTALETRVGQIASGHAGAAASGVFDDLRREMTALGQRVDANEARLAALEKSSGDGGAQPAGNLAPLQQKLDAAAAAVTDLTARLSKLESAHGTADVAGLTTKLTALETRIGALETEIARASKTTDGTIAAIDTRLKAVEANAPPVDLAQRLDSYALKSVEAGIEARLKALEAENSGEALHRAATMLALTQLARAANDTGSFSLQLDTYAVASPGDPMVELLRPYAKTGVPAKAALMAEFPDAARAALDAERSADARSLFSRLWANILSLVSVRQVGDVSGNTTEARLARAQAKLDTNDLTAAAAEVRAVKGVAAKPLANWLKDAFARMTLDRAVADLSARVIQSLAAPLPQPATPAPTVQQPAAPAISPAQGDQP